MKISVIICTHNPREDYLYRTIEALKVQTLPKEYWELLIIDNASNSPISNGWNLDWHPNARILVEMRKGLTAARITGFKNSTAPIILMVDDDNLLDMDYLSEYLKVSEKYPFLGAWGGSCSPEFEISPPEYIQEYYIYMACSSVKQDSWSNFGDVRSMPFGAGMCIRRIVADQYVSAVECDEKRQSLGRTGTHAVGGGEDTDIAMTGIKMGLGIGRFTTLQFTHLIPAFRLQENYLINLESGAYYSDLILGAGHGTPPKAKKIPLIRGLLGKIRRKIFWLRRKRLTFEKKMELHEKACNFLKL